MKPTLDSRQLHAFSALARRGSFTLAARDLLVTQSAVSHAIKSLETDLGCRLLDRVGRRIMLTPAGERLLQHTENILREMDAARAGLESLAQGGLGRLRIGADTTACQRILPAALRAFRLSHPKCLVRIEPGEDSLQLELVRGGQIDLAIGLEPPRDFAAFSFLPLFHDELVFVVAPRHPWAAFRTVPREAIAGESLVLGGRESRTLQLLEDYFRDEKVPLGNVIELGSQEAAKALVQAGIGAGVLAPWQAQRELESGALVLLPLGGRRLPRRWGLIHLRGRRLAVAEQSFVELCLQAAASLRPGDSGAAA